MLAARMKNLSPYIPGEQPQDGKYIKLNTNENPYPPSPSIKDFLADIDTGRLKLYPEPTSRIVREAVADEEGLKPENVFVGNGSDEVLSFVFYAFFDSIRGPLLFPEFTYSFYPVYCAYYGIDYEKIALRDNFSIDISAYEGKKSTGIIIPNPNAPTGIYLNLEEIRSLLDSAGPDKLVAIDEAYIAFGGESAASLINSYDNLLVIRTFSKSSSLAGMRLGYALGSEKLTAALTTVKDSFNSYPVDYITQKCGELSIRDKAYNRTVIDRIIATRERFAAAVEKLGWTVLPSKANFVFASRKGISGGDIYSRLKKKHILVRFFDKPGISDFVRITVGTDEEMDELITALRELQ